MKRRTPRAETGCLSQPGKRLLDLTLGSLILVLASPALVVISALVRLRIGKPVFFRQERPGLRGRSVRLIKFRTMTEKWDADGNPLPDGQRLTSLGIFLRRTSLDELPELFNVLRGEMSLVGPRPLLMKYLPYFSEREMLRHSVRPGITGWAQIHGRNFLAWDQRLAMDVWYVENWSLALDLYILLVTLWKVIRRADVAPDTDLVEPDLDQERREKRPKSLSLST